MVVFNAEDLISSLFIMGFERVDSLLYVLTLDKIESDPISNKIFQFKNEKFSDDFRNIMVHIDDSYQLKGSSTEVINQDFITNKLVQYLETIDYKEIIVNKINLIGTNRIDKLNYSFCSKEKDILSDIFGISTKEKTKIKNRMII